MKNNTFERIMLVLILISVIYGIILLSKKTASSSAPVTTFQYIPQSQKNIKNSSPGGLPATQEHIVSIDTLLITNSKLKGKNNCPCCLQAYLMMYSSTDSTNDPKDPKLLMFSLSATDTTTDPHDPKNSNQ
jgi:hypothetical protein